MCTIFSVSKTIWQLEGQTILDQIAEDSKYNTDGFGLVLMGSTPDDALTTKAKAIEPIEQMLCFLDWDRAWIHCRASTTKNETLGDCHPFVAYDSGKSYYIMHNGILSGYGADSWRVDSKLIADIINSYGVHAALAHLQEKQHFANVLITCPETGEWFMSRSAGGQLHTDGLGNYSTKACGTMAREVPAHTLESYQETLKKAPSKWERFGSYNAYPAASRDFVPYERTFPVQTSTSEATLIDRDGPSELWDKEDPHADKLPSELRNKARMFLTENYDELEAEWDRFEASQYHRM